MAVLERITKREPTGPVRTPPVPELHVPTSEVAFEVRSSCAPTPLTTKAPRAATAASNRTGDGNDENDEDEDEEGPAMAERGGEGQLRWPAATRRRLKGVGSFVFVLSCWVVYRLLLRKKI
jgi:hypothetical protein